MTDLSLLYGGDDNLLGDNMDNSYSPQKFNKMSNNDMLMEDKHSKSHNSMQQSQQAQQAQQQALQQAQMAQMAQQQAQQAQMAQQQAQQAQQAQQVQYKIENIQNTNTSLVPMNNNQSYKQQPEYDYSKKRGNEYNFFDRMNLKRTEVIKLSLFSLVIVLGISIDRMLTYYLSKYIGDNILTDFQELLLRISYPITIFLLLWIFNAI
jgi:predicted transglutaminase-like cysteine proteinase